MLNSHKITAPIVDFIGAYRALAIAICFYLVYILLFALASENFISDHENTQWFLVLFGAICGGFAIGSLKKKKKKKS